MEFSFGRDALSLILDAVVSGPLGKQRVTMVLDTVASNCMLSRKVAEKVGYSDRLNEKRIRVQSANGPMDPPLITMESMDVYGSRVEDIDVLVHDLPEGTYVDGLLGLNFLRHFKLILDFPNGKMIME